MILDSLWTLVDFHGILKDIQIYKHYDCANKIQIKQCWVVTQTVLYSEWRNWKQIKNFKVTKEGLKNGKVRCSLNIDARNENYNGLNAIKTKIAFLKDQLNFSCKSTIAASV